MFYITSFVGLETDGSVIISYRAAWKGIPIPNFQKWDEANDGQYMVLTDSEADSRADDNLDEDLWYESIRAHNTTLGFDDWKGICYFF